MLTLPDFRRGAHSRRLPYASVRRRLRGRNVFAYSAVQFHYLTGVRRTQAYYHALAVLATKLWFPDGLGNDDRLALFESRDLVGRFFEERNGRELNAGKAEEIISQVAQGRAYFASAATADVIVRPLLQYYGVLALTRALILFRTSLRESALAQGHGLKVLEWHSAFAKPDGLLAAVVRVEHGTFLQLGQATENHDELQLAGHHGPPVATTASTDDAIQPGTTFIVDDLLSRVPQLNDVYSLVRGRVGRHWRAELNWEATTLLLTVYQNGDSLPSEARMRELLSIGPEPSVSPHEEEFFRTGRVKEMRAAIRVEDLEKIRPHLSALREDYGGYYYVVEPFDSGLTMSSLSSVFAMSFVLGMLVRYYPSQWLAMLAHKRGDALLPLLRSASDIIGSFPALILRAM